MENEYINSGIWRMRTPRDSCIVPEQPLLISEAEEWELNELCLSVWEATESAIELSEYARNDVARNIREQGRNFPGGTTMPPAIRVDVVRTKSGPKIVEIDPITAISLGETAFLTNNWRRAGFKTVASPQTAIVRRLMDSGYAGVTADLPATKLDYCSEVNYLVCEVNESMRTLDVNYGAKAALSAFIEDPKKRRNFNKGALTWRQNPLWGSLIGLADKSNLAYLKRASLRLSKFVVAEITREELPECSQDYVVAKPIKGTGSSGIRIVSPKEAIGMPNGMVFQELLKPVEDYFGESVGAGWVSRLSVYAGRCGLEGAQVTARRRDGAFTNVHGQADAIQTTIAIN